MLTGELDELTLPLVEPALSDGSVNESAAGQVK